jgi:site-specific DNA-methyltransferase (adenine-specific)
VNVLHHGDALQLLTGLGGESVDLIYTDPPFNTGRIQRSKRQKAGRVLSDLSYGDTFEDYEGFLREHLVHLRRVLRTSGTLYLHLDRRSVHLARGLCDEIFGSDCFLNEVIWAYDFGGRGRRCWPHKHDNILVYVREPGQHIFNWDDIDRIPYMAPGLQTPERAKTGKVPTDVWWMSIVGTQSKERTGYPSQKPVALIERAIRASSPEGGIILDPFAGSGTTGAAAHNLGRSFILSDKNPEAITVMQQRFADSGILVQNTTDVP